MQDPAARRVRRGAAGLLGLALASIPPTMSAAGSDARPQVEPDMPVTATNATKELAQNSPTLAVDPTDERFVALASRIDGQEFSCALHVSGDGGRTW
ncbi:MAG: hypothetical protein ACRD2W_00255 [Acidimicrobiales bacterium]